MDMLSCGLSQLPLNHPVQGIDCRIGNDQAHRRQCVFEEFPPAVALCQGVLRFWDAPW